VEKRAILKEIIGVLLLAAAIFTGISLLSYSPRDPSLNVVRSVAGQPIHNLLGTSGAMVSDITLQILGLSGFVIPLLLFINAFYCFTHITLTKYLIKVLSLASVGFAIGAMAGIFTPKLKFMGNTIPSAGIFGTFINSYVTHYIGRLGAFLLYLVVIWTGVALFINRSLFAILKPVIRIPVKWAKSITNRVSIKKEQTKRKKAVEEKEKRLKWKETAPEITMSIATEKPKEKVPKQEHFAFMEQTEGAKDFILPPVSLLKQQPASGARIDEEILKINSKLLLNKLNDYGISGRIVRVNPGPIITVYEFEPAPGIKLSRIVNLSDDLAMALSAISIRIVAPIPGKSVVGIEIPNRDRETVFLRPLLEFEGFSDPRYRLPLALGKDIAGLPYITDLSQMPHLLVAGSTGSGKSVALNCMILSLIYRLTPEQLRFLMIDPKMLELSLYEDIPHLLMPVVTDPKNASKALMWLVEEMERRYAHLADYGVRNILQYHELLRKKKKKARMVPDRPLPGEKVKPGSSQDTLPYVVVVIDELADLMLTASKDVEGSITRLAQMARAVGIHLILATQRPSVDVLTGIIKANFPARISFRVASKTDARTILDHMGSESLLGHGDMLFLPPGTSQMFRLHGPYISSSETSRIVSFLKKQGKPDYVELALTKNGKRSGLGFEAAEEEYDEKYDEAVAFVAEAGQASISMIQRRFRIGYNRAARIVEKMEDEGVVAPSDGVKPRKVLVPKIYK
jgi:S-DNA-T family DNA segregation ATPase FtsK/SpoIIIE